MVLNGDDYVIDYMIFSLLMYSLLKEHDFVLSIESCNYKKSLNQSSN